MRLDNISEKEKREKIINCLDKNMFVEAGAGAGKTTIIVKRIINQLMAGIKPNEIVAITFTNAATRELKGRILGEASRIANEDHANLTKEEHENLKAALDELDQMQISTIHSFCYRILSEKMFDAGLPYGFALAEESDMEELRNRYFTLWAETLKRTDWERLLPTGKYRSGVITRIRNLTNRLDHIPDDYEIKVAIDDISEDEARKRLAPFTDKVSADALNLINYAYKASFASFGEIGDEYLTRFGKDLKIVLAEADVIAVCKKLLSLPDSKSFIMKTVTKDDMVSIGIKDKDDQKEYKERLTDQDDKIRNYLTGVRDDIEKIKAGYQNTLYRPYISYAQDALKYIRSRSVSGIISNDKLLEKTKELIKSSDDVRRFFGNKFRIIYVDEFQDTDHMQESFIRLLASDPSDSEKLRDGALFVVGDPKQSIYRFRGAEPEVYFTTKERMQDLENAYVVELSDNYRSNERIINWVNDRFKDKDITIGQNYIPMNAVKYLPDKGMPEKLFAGVYRYKSPESSLKGPDIGSDMEAVSRLILSLVGNGYLIADYDKNNNLIYREIRYSDFLVLSMNTPGMDGYADCFHRYGIPVVMDSKSDVRCDHDLLTFVRLYAFLASPGDLSARMGALEALDVSGSPDRARNERILIKIKNDTEKMSAYGCVRYLMNNASLFMYKESETEDYRIQDMQKKLIQMTEHIMAQSFGNRGTILRAMYEYLESEVEHELLLKQDVNAVRFMNLHKAKGLEGNIVIWTNRQENREFKEGEYRCDQTFYPSVGYKQRSFFVTEWVAYGGERRLIDAAKTEDESESIRLEYVAATRAKQAMVFMDRYNAKAGNMFTDGYDLNGLDSVEDIVSEYKQQTATNSALKITESMMTKHEKDVSSYVLLKEAVYSSESPSSYEDDSAGKSLIQNDPQTKTNNLRPTGNILGTVMHRAFELVVERRDTDPKVLGIEPAMLVSSCVRQAVNESIDDIDDKEIGLYEQFLNDAVMAFGKWFWRSDIKRDAVKIYTELPFAYLKKSADTGCPVWMHGEADLVIQLKDDSYYVIDYKSDSDEAYPDEKSFEERLRGKYTPQIKAYKEAVSRVFKTGEDKIKTVLISFSQKDTSPGERLRLRVTTI